MNRRELIKSLLILPIIPTLGMKYKTPETDRIVYKLINNTWVEYPFDELEKSDIIRIASGRERLPDDKVFIVDRVFPYVDKYQPNGISLHPLNNI